MVISTDATVSAAVGWGRGMLPLRPAPFLTWAHRAGLLRVTGRTYQFRHRALQQWLRDEAQRREDIKRLARSSRKRSLEDGQRLEAARQLAVLDASAGILALAWLAADSKVGLHQRIMAMEARTVLHEERDEDDERDEALALVRQFAEVPLLEADSYEYRWATDALTRLDPAAGRDLLIRLVHGARAGKGGNDIRLWAATTLTQLDPQAGAGALASLALAGYRQEAVDILTRLAADARLEESSRAHAAHALATLGDGGRDQGDR